MWCSGLGLLLLWKEMDHFAFYNRYCWVIGGENIHSHMKKGLQHWLSWVGLRGSHTLLKRLHQNGLWRRYQCVSVCVFVSVCVYIGVYVCWSPNKLSEPCVFSLWQFCLTSLKSGRRGVNHVLAALWHGCYMNNVALATAQSRDLTAGALAGAHQLRAIFAHRRGLVGLGPKHSRPMHYGRVSGAGVVHGNWWNWSQLCK